MSPTHSHIAQDKNRSIKGMRQNLAIGESDEGCVGDPRLFLRSLRLKPYENRNCKTEKFKVLALFSF